MPDGTVSIIEELQQEIATQPTSKGQAILAQMQQGRPSGIQGQAGIQLPGFTTTEPVQQPSGSWLSPMTWLQKGFGWAQEHLEEPWAAGLWGAGVSLMPGTQSGEAAFREAREREGWLSAARTGYEQANLPWGGKFGLEMSMPLWWAPYAGWTAKGGAMLAGGARQAGRAGLARGLETATKIPLQAERAIAYPITKPLGMLGKKIRPTPKVPPKAIDEALSDLPTMEWRMGVDFTPDAARQLGEKLGEVPIARSLMYVANPSGMVTNEWQKQAIGYVRMLEEGQAKSTAALSHLQATGADRVVFALDERGMVRAANLAESKLPLGWGDIFRKPHLYPLNEAQKAYIEVYNKVGDRLTALLKKNKIMAGQLPDTATRPLIRELAREPGEFYVHRVAYEVRGIAVNPRIKTPVGAKQIMGKPRWHDTMQAGIEADVKYLGPLETMEMRVAETYKMIADQRLAGSLKVLKDPATGKLLSQLPSEKVRVSSFFTEAARGDLARVAGIVKLVRAARRRALKGSELNTIEQTSRELANELRRIKRGPGGGIVKAEGERFQALLDDALAEVDRLGERAGLRKGQRTRAMEFARLPAAGESIFRHPALAQRTFPREVVQETEKILSTEINSILRAARNINDMSRMLQTAIDIGNNFIQTLPLFFTNPFKWAKVAKMQVETILDPSVFPRILAKPEYQAIINELGPHGLVLGGVGTTEYTRALSEGYLARTLRPRALTPVRKGFERFALGFEASGTMARLEMAKAVLPMARRQGEAGLRETAAILNNMTGVQSSRWLGVSATERAAEAGVFLYAPRYFRAAMGAMLSIYRGDITGQVARQMVGSMLLGALLWYHGITKALGQEMQLDPTKGKFLSVKIGGTNVGIGSVWTAMARFGGNFLSSATTDPGALIKPDTRDNALLKFARSRLAPITGSTWDVVTGRNFIGEPIDPMPWSPSFTEHITMNRLMPFWLEGVVSLTGAETAMPTKMAAEFMGMRAWPLQPYEKADELREEYAQADFGKPWVELNRLQKKQVEEGHEDLQKMIERAAEISKERGRPEEQLVSEYLEQIDRAREMYEQELWQAQRAYEAGQMSGRQFRESATQAGKTLGATYDFLAGDERYAPAIKELEKGEKKEVYAGDVAYNEYIAMIVAAPDLEDEYGQFRYDEYRKRQDAFRAKWGEGIWNYVQQRRQQGKDEPPLMGELRQARETLQPYWNIRRQIIEAQGLQQVDAEIDRLENMGMTEQAEQLRQASGIAMIDKYVQQSRLGMRMASPEVWKAHRQFY